MTIKTIIPILTSILKRNLEGLDPFDNRLSTDELHHYVNKEKRKEMNHIWYVTCDI